MMASQKNSRRKNHSQINASLIKSSTVAYVQPSHLNHDWPDVHADHLDNLEDIGAFSHSSETHPSSGKKPLSFSLQKSKRSQGASSSSGGVPHLYDSFIPASQSPGVGASLSARKSPNTISSNKPDIPLSASQDPTTGLYVTSLYVTSTNGESSSSSMKQNTSSRVVQASLHKKQSRPTSFSNSWETIDSDQSGAQSHSDFDLQSKMLSLSFQASHNGSSAEPKTRRHRHKNADDSTQPDTRTGVVKASLTIKKEQDTKSTKSHLIVKETNLPQSGVKITLLKKNRQEQGQFDMLPQKPQVSRDSSSSRSQPDINHAQDQVRGKTGRRQSNQQKETLAEPPHQHLNEGLNNQNQTNKHEQTPRKKLFDPYTDSSNNRTPKNRNDRRERDRHGDATPKDSPFKSPRGNKPKENFFEEYISSDKVEQGLQNGTLHVGKFRINKTNRNEAYVTAQSPTSLADDVFIPKSRLQNRAFDGDVVVVKLLDGEELEKEMKDEKDRKEKKMAESHTRQKICEVEEIEAVDVFEHQETRIFGKVVYIQETNSDSRVFVGTLSLERHSASSDQKTKADTETKVVNRYVWFKPNDKRAPFLAIPRETAPKEFIENPDQFMNILVTSSVRKWSASSRSPLGDYLGKLGQMGEIGVESKALLTAAGITWDDFSGAQLDCLPATPWSIPEEELAKRLDVRDERIFSIDPPTARDLDDALSCKELPDGNLEIGVHIADVSFFVKPDTALDKEAMFRATTVYLVQKAIPMLPRLLCEELCSLNPGVDRLAFSVFWTFTRDGEVIGKPRFARTIIRSCAKLSYDHAQAIIDGRSWDTLPSVTIHNGVTKAQVDHDLLNLYKLSLILRQKRYDDGAITFHSIKLWFALDEVGNPINTGVYEIKDSNRLVEEFMLLANMAVAQKISSAFPDCALLRRHQPPVSRVLSQFIEDAKSRGFNLDPSTSTTLNDSFEKIENPLHRYLLRLLCIKSMKRAVYFCTGCVDISEWGHYALSVPLYTHFTSPIRRYCDVIVHRLLDMVLRDDVNSHTCKTIGAVAKQCNARKDMAKEGQDASQKLFLCAYLSRLQNLPPFALSAEDEANGKLPGVIAYAHINSLNSRSFDVVCDSFGIEKRVFVEDTMAIDKSLVGCKSFDNNHQLALFWRRKDGDTEPGDSLNEMLAADASDDHPRGESTTAGLDPATTKVQVLRMFSRVQVRIVTNMQTSPPDYKLFALYPDGTALKQEVETERVLFEQNPMLDEQSAVFVENCPAIEFTAD